MPIISAPADFIALKNAVLPMQAVVAGRLAAVLPVVEHGATVGTARVSISIWPNELQLLGTGFSNPPVNTKP